ncbi:MAG: DUF4199 domain-containing protein [Tannerellaceae bacterium]|nr:DUF4199 domain-containing protein [Tannerellaceae bacterium]MCD8265510.1 DUF4199 domain-containing protein [Tannerellaceae bacterium]
MAENRGLLMKSAMHYGLAFGLFWVFKYIFFMFGLTMPSLIFIYWGFTIAVPFIAYLLTRKYKYDIGGQISFFHAWQFGILLYFFAALIMAVMYYIFYSYIAPPDLITTSINQAMEMLQGSDLEEKLQEAVESSGPLTPIRVAVQGIFNNTMYGILFSIPVAAILCRNNQTGMIYPAGNDDKQ